MHIPFCVTKCNYCDFNTYAGIEELMSEYVSAMVEEIGMWGGGVGWEDSGADDFLRKVGRRRCCRWVTWRESWMPADEHSCAMRVWR